MKTQQPHDQNERLHFPSLPSAIHARLASLAMAGPSNSGGSAATRATSIQNNFSRFSLRRLFNTSPFGHSPSTQHCQNATESDSHSESGSLARNCGAERKDSSSLREAFHFIAAGSSSDSESNSFSSGHNETQNSCSNQNASGQIVECPLCLLELPLQCFPELSSCSHRACHNCLQQYLKIEITESRVNISCPECTEPIHPSDIRAILNDESLVIKYENFMLRRILVAEPDVRWCPAPDCGYAVIASGCASCPKLKCERPGCNTSFCYHCKQEWHPNQTCDAARAQRARHSSNPRSASVSFSQDSVIHTGDDVKPCPCCKVLIIKMDDGSCNHMTCSFCGTEFCWLCMKEISDLHYLSPSGCTFWGKKPWSRKKKIMWQLGMLVGAPIGIALIAGIAVPAIIIGIPVWVGRKIHAKYSSQSSNKHVRNLWITTGVLASVLVSPVLAGIAVGIGVPILLAYVYGVVPISLCRSGGCGVTTSASGVRIEFDEENEIGMGGSVAAADGVSVDTAASHRGVNPSIGEVSLGMSTSLSLGSGSQIERVGLIRDRDSDRESASNTALAGSIASASLLTTGNHKLEVQADVSSNKRFSLSSHSETASATVSLSERSVNMSQADDASTRALAGSLLGCRDNAAVTPVEVHVDAQSSPEENSSPGIIRPNPDMVLQLDECDGICNSSDKVENSMVAAICPGGEEGGIQRNSSSFRFKWWRLSSHRHQSCVGLADAIPETSQDLSLLNSVNDSATSASSHVHFNELRECCVSYIDESPVGDEREGSIKQGENALDSVRDTKDCHSPYTKRILFQKPYDDNSVSLDHIDSESNCKNNETLPAIEKTKALSSIDAHCNQSHILHFSHEKSGLTRTCSEESGRQEAIQNLATHPSAVFIALHDRAYSLGDSMHDVSADSTAKDKELIEDHRKPYMHHLARCNSKNASHVTVNDRASINHKLANLPHVEEPEFLSHLHSKSRSFSAPHTLRWKKEISVHPQPSGHKMKLLNTIQQTAIE